MSRARVACRETVAPEQTLAEQLEELPHDELVRIAETMEEDMRNASAAMDFLRRRRACAMPSFRFGRCSMVRLRTKRSSVCVRRLARVLPLLRAESARVHGLRNSEQDPSSLWSLGPVSFARWNSCVRGLRSGLRHNGCRRWPRS